MFKKTSFVLIFTFLFLMVPSVSFSASFTDVSSSHKNYVAIEFLKEKGVINGYQDSTFKPEGSINRAEALKIIVEAFDVDNSTSYSGEFSDVKSSDWYSQYVSAGRKAGIIKGYSDGTFKAGNTLILAEALKIVLIGAKMEVLEKVDMDVFSDVKASDWFSVYASFARDKNLILGDKMGRIHPMKEISRAEFAELIYRIIIVKENSGKAFDLALNWPKFDTKFGISMKANLNRWKVESSQNSAIFYDFDESFSDLSAGKVFPDSAKIGIYRDLNTGKVSTSDYFSKLKSAFSGTSTKEFKYRDLPAIEFVDSAKRTVDWYIYNNSGVVYGIFTEYGNGILAFQYPKEISAMLNSLEMTDSSLGSFDKENILNEIFANILIKNKGKSSLDLLPDKTIFETDTIGVGTGPVDYYYCSAFDISFKYERNDDLILDKRDGKTSAF